MSSGGERQRLAASGRDWGWPEEEFNEIVTHWIARGKRGPSDLSRRGSNLVIHWTRWGATTEPKKRDLEASQRSPVASCSCGHSNGHAEPVILATSAD